MRGTEYWKPVKQEASVGNSWKIVAFCFFGLVQDRVWSCVVGWGEGGWFWPRSGWVHPVVLMG